MTDTIDAYIRDYIAKLGWSWTQKRAAKQQFEKKEKMGCFYSHGTQGRRINIKTKSSALIDTFEWPLNFYVRSCFAHPKEDNRNCMFGILISWVTFAGDHWIIMLQRDKGPLLFASSISITNIW